VPYRHTITNTQLTLHKKYHCSRCTPKLWVSRFGHSINRVGVNVTVPHVQYRVMPYTDKTPGVSGDVLEQT
jgi:hypothetical protein